MISRMGIIQIRPGMIEETMFRAWVELYVAGLVGLFNSLAHSLKFIGSDRVVEFRRMIQDRAVHAADAIQRAGRFPIE